MTQKLKCLIVDDEQPARELIKSYIQNIPELEFTAECSNVLDAKQILDSEDIDILLLDIQMPNLSGLDFLKITKKQPATILITAFSEYALEGYELDVIDYLLKPAEFDRFYRAISKAIDWIKSRNHNTSVPAKESITENAPEFIFIKADKEIVKIKCDQILFIESLREFVQIHTAAKKHITLQALSKFEEILPKDYFFRIHRSSIVNIKAIDKIIGNTVFIGKNQLSISRGQKELFFEMINRNKLF